MFQVNVGGECHIILSLGQFVSLIYHTDVICLAGCDVIVSVFIRFQKSPFFIGNRNFYLAFISRRILGKLNWICTSAILVRKHLHTPKRFQRHELGGVGNLFLLDLHQSGVRFIGRLCLGDDLS